MFFFHSKKTASEAHRELQKVYGDAALSETTCRDWFRRFKDGDFDVDDRPREGRPKTSEDTELEALLDENPCQTQEKFALALGVTRQAISKRLHALGIIQKQGTWVPYDLKPRDVKRRFFACEQLLQLQKRKGHVDCPVMFLRRRFGRIFTLRKLCCVFGGTRSVLFIMSC